MARKRNPRRVLLEMLKTPRQRMDWIRGQFETRGIVYDDDVSGFRKRLPHEYPESKPDLWADVYRQAISAMDEWRAIAYFANDQRVELNTNGYAGKADA